MLFVSNFFQFFDLVGKFVFSMVLVYKTANLSYFFWVFYDFFHGSVQRLWNTENIFHDLYVYGGFSIFSHPGESYLMILAI